jgi:hypothetical protein
MGGARRDRAAWGEFDGVLPEPHVQGGMTLMHYFPDYLGSHTTNMATTSFTPVGN